MPNINRNVIYLGVAILLGVAASVMAVHYVNSQVVARTRRTRAGNAAMEQVVVPQRDLAKGATLSMDAIAVRKVPSDFVPADALTPDNYQRYVGQVLRAPLAHGAPIPASAIELLANHFSDLISAGEVAYSVEVNETNAISGLIVPGDHIDLLMLTGGDHSTIRPLLGDVLVLATGRRATGVKGTDSGDGGGADSYADITLELTPAQAQRVGMALKVGQLRVLLRPPGSRGPLDLKLLSKADLLRSRRKRSGIPFIIGGNG